MGSLGCLVVCVVIYGLTELVPDVSAKSQITIPSGCSRLSLLVNGLPHGWPHLNIPHLNLSHLQHPMTLAPKHAIRSPDKRFIIGDIDMSAIYTRVGKLVSDAVQAALPKTKEIQNTCRIGVGTTSHTNVAFLRAVVSMGMKLCAVCDDLDGGKGTCDKIGICSSTSMCYRGHNRDYKSSDTSAIAAAHPPAYSHGCCDPAKDAHCHTSNYAVSFSSSAKANYSMWLCSGFMCNADYQLHSKTSSLSHTLLDGHWASWGHWSTCSHTCGTGLRTRKRTCSNPAPLHGGRSCAGSSSGSESCLVTYCAVNGHWASWSAWGRCSSTCGTATKTRTRTCTHPAPANGGHTCSGLSKNTVSCRLSACPVDGHWASWGHWSTCSHTCGTGVRTRKRTCSNPAPLSGGRSCSGSSSLSESCHVTDCAVDGHWASWSTWGKCSSTCGTATKTRTRTCSHPAPAHGGHTCSGSSSSTTQCHQSACSVAGGWTHWTSWSACSVSCEAGARSRTRTCTNPAPAHGGASCSGHGSEKGECNDGTCPVWSHWFYDSCSVTCGNGTTTRLRHCSSGHDEDCTGVSFEKTTCQESPCSVDGGWGSWTRWSACSKTCGEGLHNRHRSCDSPAPAYNGRQCVGDVTQTTACNTDDCPHWLAFSAVSSCSVTCGQGVILYQRNCSTGHMDDCTGSTYDERPCSQPSC